jgi:hypothetical protein
MDTTRHTADRVRPILQAMERSIDAARQQRLRASGRPSQISAEPVPSIAPPASQVPAPIDTGSTSAAPRLKARPKRSLTSYAPTTLRSRAS